MFFFITRSRWSGALPFTSLLLAAASCVAWLYVNWDYFPEWAPFPTELVNNSLTCLVGPLVLCLCAPLIAVATVIGTVANLIVILDRFRANRAVEVALFIVGMGVLGSSALPWLFRDQINDHLLDYAISRYDPVVDAIEKYHSEHGRYPDMLYDLVPTYMPAVPGIYMKYGESLTYRSENLSMVDQSPFIFELYGHSWGMHGQNLKYCPQSFDPCYRSDRHIWMARINERWIWVFSKML
ncbi:MAG: hypothetical protein HZB53_12720 [Chloroflexi bacterium]|nr:hypothetical protein [Chloroflexota bacterium]